MKRLWSFIFLLSAIIGNSQCNYELCITDDFGDGWNGNTVDVFVNGNLYGNYGASLVGSGPECFFIAVNNGDAVDVIFNATGTSANECNFALTDASGNQAGAGDDISNINNAIGNCPCEVTAVSTSPELILNCSGMQDTINFVAGGICAGNYEYQVLIGGTVVQGWSTSSVFYSSPSSNTSYTVQARCSACPTLIASDNFDVEIIDPPTISGVLEFCATGSTSITASGSTGDFEWYTDETGGTQLATTPTYTTPNLNDTTTYWLQANGLSASTGKILITECGLEGFAGASSADYLEISNLYATPVNTTGWVAAISADYNNINNVNTILWDLPSTFSACSVESRNDISSDPNYWGNNIMWNPGANTTYRSWAIIIDNNGNVVDFVAWGWSAADIAGFNTTINGFNITLGPEWSGDGCDATCGVAGGAPLSIQRIGNQDGNTLADFVCQASTPDVVNPGLSCGWTPVSCRTPVTVIVNPPPIIDMSEDTAICNGNSVELFADTNGILVEEFTMNFDSPFSYSTINTSLPGSYYAVVSGTFSGSGPCEERDGGFLFYQGCNNIIPIPSYPWQWNGANPNTQSQVPTVYNPNHIYNFYFNGGSSQSFSFQEQNVSWYGDNSGSLTFQIFYLGDILWSNGVTTPSNNVSPSQTTTYTVSIDYGNGCLATESVVVTVSDPAYVENIVPSTCGNANGEISLVANNGIAPYQFSIDNGITFQSSGLFTGLMANSYDILIVDNIGCQVTAPLTVSDVNGLTAQIDAQNNVSCFGGSDGSLTASASGASPNYQFSIDGGVTFQASGTFNNLSQGPYTITVKDANNCETTVNATLNEPAIVEASYVSSTDATCGNTNGTFEVTGSGGTSSFDYSIDGGVTYQTSGIFSSLLAGSYTATVKDANNCTATIVVTINNLGGPTIDQVTEINASCNGTCDGQVAVNSTGATQYSIDNGVNFQASNVFTNICAGTHVLVVTNTIGCLEYSTATVTEPLPLVVNVNTTNLSCYDVCNGEIDITATGGTTPMQYSVDNGASFSLSGTFTGICAGTHDIIVNDGGTCTHSTQAIISEPALLATTIDITDATCTGSCDGSINATAFGGTGTYTYSWNPAQTGNNSSAQNLCVGPLSLLIEDANGCSVDTSLSVGGPPGIVISGVDATDILCNGDCNGSITINATDASQFSIDGNTYTSNNVFTGLCAGAYTVYAQNSNGCFEVEQVSVGSPAILTVIAQSDTTICNGGTASLNAFSSGGVGPYVYSWDNNMTTQGINVSPSTSQTYCIRVTDANACVSNLSCLTVTVNPPINANALSDQTICPEDLAQISASASGGDGGPYNYNWNQGVGAGSNQAVSPSGTTVYTVSVSDGCETPVATASVTITTHPVPNIGFSADVLSGCMPIDVTFEEINIPAGSQCLWSFGDGGTSNDCNDVSYVFTQAGCWNISLAITTPEGCATGYDAPNYICVYEYPSASFTFSPQPTNILTPTIDFVNTSSGASAYDWTFDVSGMADSDNAENPVYTFPNEPGTYEVCLNATSNEGCSTDTCANVLINDELLLYVPNSFTPNGDGINDVFAPFVNGADPLNYDLLIFNRWGELIFEEQHSSKGWDGYQNGVLAQDGVYVWKINCKEVSGGQYHEYIGHVTLMR